MMAFERTFPKQSSEVVFQFISCLQQRWVVSKKEERQKLEVLMKTFEDWTRMFCKGGIG